MVRERRAFSNYPDNQKTAQNDRETFIADDLLFEPEKFDFLNGFIGDVSRLTTEDLQRTPQIVERDAERQKYQLSIGATFIDPDTQNRVSGAFYTDVLRQIDVNGGIIDDPNRLFSTDFYAWTPPIDYDKHINFSRYIWVGVGTADVNGEYVTKEPAHSKITIYEFDGSAFIKRDVEVVIGLPAPGPAGTFVEDASTIDRFIYRSDGITFIQVGFTVVPDIPTDFTGFVAGDLVYITRTGPEFNRPLVWLFSEIAGRWIPQPVVVDFIEPDRPREGMVWEDARIDPRRPLKIFTNGAFLDLVYTPQDGPTGIGIDGEYIYDTRDYADITDGWVRENWWRHTEDLAAVDLTAAGSAGQSVRPILEFWNGLEPIPGDNRDFRNDTPFFKKFAFDLSTTEIIDTGESTTIFQYKIGTGGDDLVLGFPVTFNATGEFVFDLTLEADTSAFTGYKFFRESISDLVHSIWMKSDVKTVQEEDADGLFEIPKGITSNPDHEVLTEVSRSRMLFHMTSVIEAQDAFAGDKFGLNSWRWTRRNLTVGATIIDNEQTLLRVLALLQSANLDLPNAIRRIAKEYNKVLFRFVNRLNQLWDDNTLSDVADTLLVTPSEAVDAILTELFIGRNEDFPFFFSDMGTYLETRVFNGVVSVIDPAPRPIFVPSSAARNGAAPCFNPESFVDRDGTALLRGHDGQIIESFGDDRDLVWLELQTRFFDAIPPFYCTESSTFSSRFSVSNFFLDDFFGNLIPITDIEPVDEVVDDFNTVVGATPGQRVFSKLQAVFATFNGASWFTTPANTDDTFFNNDDGEFYIFNGLGTFIIDTFNRPFTFDYSDNEFKRIIRREFERFIVTIPEDFTVNDTFDISDRFTWNFRSAGVEGNYVGIYRRVYNTERPHSHPWEVVGYKIEPDWWRTQYVPDSTAADGTPRYGSAHPMWVDFAAGFIDHPVTPFTRVDLTMVAPPPVDAVGELLDPIAAGVVDEGKLDLRRIDDGWVYGDGSPVEQEFIRSAFYAFSFSLTSFLMKTVLWIDNAWSEVFIDIGDVGANQIFRAPHVVHRDTLTRPAIADLPIHLEVDDSGNTIQRLGINAWISESVRIAGGSPQNDFGRVIRNTSPALSWRTSGFINEDRTIITTLANIEIPFEDVHVILHRSQPFESEFVSGVLIVREEPGYRVFGFDPFDPFFRVELPEMPVVGAQSELQESFIVEAVDPSLFDGSVFRNGSVIRSFTLTELTFPSQVQDGDTAKFGVLINGLRIKPQHIKIISNTEFEIEDLVELEPGDVVTASVITAPSTASTRVRQFVVQGVSFPYFATGSGQFASIEYGRFFETSTDVINFMIGYGRFLESRGWVFDSLDETTGENLDWLLGAKRFAAFVLDTESPWNPRQQTSIVDETIFMFSPIRRQAKFISTFGQAINVESIQNGAFGILNENSEPIDVDKTTVSRSGDTLVVDAIADEDMFGVRINVVEFEHAVFFSNITRFNDINYDPPTALFHSTLRVDSYRSIDWEGRLEADGFIIDGNILLPNFEKQAFDFTRFYDRINTIDDPVKRDQARNLYGFSPPISNEYMVPIGATDRSRFDYFRGMIQTKGTIRPITAFHRGTTIGKDNVFVSEDWAWKVAVFGDKRREIIQFVVNKNDFRDEAQVIFFGEPETVTDNIIEIPNFDRSDPNNNPRWILPPILGKNLLCNVAFPVDENGLPDVASNRFFVKLFDTDTVSGTDTTVLTHFHYDPELGKFENEANCQIDFEQILDPARYNNGPEAIFSNKVLWGAEQVGMYWWDINRRQYVDYRSLIPDYEKVAVEWGKLLFFKANITRTDEIVTVETLDPFGSGVPTAHGLTTGDEVSITGAKETDYNVTDIEITVTSPTEFEFEIDTQPASPATGDPRVTVGAVDIYEWVESTVPPDEFVDFVEAQNNPDATGGVPLNVDDPSFVRIDRVVSGGITESRFYFWVRNNSGLNPGKKFTAVESENRITNPTGLGIPWFAIVDVDHMIVFTDGEKVQDGFAIEVITDRRELETHLEWVLVSEKNQFLAIPQQVVDKLIDSMSKKDALGNEVPSPLLADTEKFGACFLPIQTVFADVALAVDVYVEALNTIFRGKNLSEVDILTGIFKLEDELDETTNPTGFWQRADFIESEFVDKEIFETVATEAERDFRADNGFYTNGDLVKVTESSNIDPFTGDVVSTTFLFDGTSFSQVGVENNTVAINNNLALNADTFRDNYFRTFNVLTKLEQNNLTFSLLHEMLRQTIVADWFFKTSYITTQIFTPLSASPFVLPDENSAIVANIIDVKPFRTKLRGEQVTVTLDTIENFPTEIIEFPDKKISLIFDRLSCDLTDDGGWNAFPWDSPDPPAAGWDKPFWDFEDVGRAEFYLLETFTGNSIDTSFVAIPLFDPTLYNNKVVIKDNGVEIDPAQSGIEVTITKTSTSITIETNFALPANFTIELFQSQGFYEGNEPILGGTAEGSLFRPAPIDYKHFFARTLVTSGDDAFDPSSVMAGCIVNDELGGRPEERIVTEVINSVNICVKNEHTPAYAGWDTTPWDINPWDESPTDIGTRILIIGVGEQQEIAPGIEVFQTSDTITAGSTDLILGGSEDFTIEQIEIQKGGVGPFLVLTEGVEFDPVEPFQGIIQFNTPASETFIADGATTTFVPTFTSGVNEVFRNGFLQTLGVNYNLLGSDIQFVQPPNFIIENNATAFGTSHVGDSVETGFDTNTDPTTLQKENLFAFLNGTLALPTDYNVNTINDIEFIVTPVVDDQILLFAINNDFNDSSALFDVQNFIGDGGTTNFLTGQPSVESNTFVFVDGRYQVLNADYTIPLTGKIQFIVAPVFGTDVEIRTITPGVFDIEHGIYTANGSASTVLGIPDAQPGSPDLSNADNPVIMMVFLDDVIQDGYTTLGIPDFTISNTNPDTINWTLLPEISKVTTTGDVNGSLSGTFFTIDSPSTAYYVWYDVAARAELTIITALADVANSLLDKFFLLDTPGTDYYVWYDVSGSGTDPLVAGRTGISVAITTGDVATTVATATAAAIDAIADFSAPAPPSDIFTVTNTTAGAVPDAVDGTAPTGFSFLVGVQGIDAAIDPAPGGKTTITVSVSGDDSALDIADATAIAINLVADFISGAGGLTVTIENVVTGNVPNTADSGTPTGFTFVTEQEGVDPPTGGQNISVRLIRTIRVSSTTVVNVLPQVDDVIVATANSFLESSDKVRFRYNGWPVGKLGDFTIDDTVSPFVGASFDVVREKLVFDTLPLPDQFLSVTFIVSRPGDSPTELFVFDPITLPLIVNDLLDDHLIYDAPLGFEDNRPVGTAIVNKTTGMIHVWDGIMFDENPMPIGNFFVTRTQEILNFNGTIFTLLFQMGDPSIGKPPIIDYPAFGEGIVSATYSLGQHFEATIFYPDAFEVMQPAAFEEQDCNL